MCTEILTLNVKIINTNKEKKEKKRRSTDASVAVPNMDQIPIGYGPSQKESTLPPSRAIRAVRFKLLVFLKNIVIMDRKRSEI